jgi:hypothetical protein
MKKKYLLAIALLFCLPSSKAQSSEQPVKIPDVNPSLIKATMSFLASDMKEGRQPGTRGFDIASQYVQSQFTEIGLEPGGSNGYVQAVPLQKGIVNTKESQFSLITKGKEQQLEYGKDFIFSPYFTQDQSEITAPLIFVGYGAYAPELGYDDFKGVDVKGKIVVVLDQAPDTFANTERAYFSSASSKYLEAEKRGAVGVLTLTMSRRTSWEALTRRASQGSFKWIDKSGKPGNAFEKLKVIGVINETSNEKFFVNSGKKLQDVFAGVKTGKPQSFDLNVSATLKVSTQRSIIASSNLIGIIPGSDASLKNEFIVYVAHLDHFGIGRPVNNDSIYNGAHDNASGVAILLEIARAYKALAIPPKRSIAIAIVTGEESGLLGSDYFVNNSTLPGSIVANLTIDMPFFFHPILDIVPYGAQHSSLSKQVEEATTLLNLKISPDPFPEQVVFIRSDHFSFVKKGVPALFIKSGFMTVPSDTTDRSKSDVAWRSTIYHTPQDDMRQQFDFNAAATHVKVNFLIGLLAANASSKPEWNKGDFFGARFGKK